MGVIRETRVIVREERRWSEARVIVREEGRWTVSERPRGRRRGGGVRPE